MSSIAITTSVSSQIAAQNAMRANRQHRAECMLMMPGYQHQTATVQEMRFYAGCVDKLHPAPASPEGIIALKLAVALLILATIGGLIYGWRIDPYSRLSNAILFGIFWLVGAALAMLALYLLIAGILFLVG